jgi:enamidase
LFTTATKKQGCSLLRTAKELKQVNRVILGTDSPAGSGVQPLGTLRMISILSSLGDTPAEVAVRFATGNTARIRKLDCGLIEVGRDATFVLIDRAQAFGPEKLYWKASSVEICRVSGW